MGAEVPSEGVLIVCMQSEMTKQSYLSFFLSVCLSLSLSPTSFYSFRMEQQFSGLEENRDNETKPSVRSPCLVPPHSTWTRACWKSTDLESMERLLTGSLINLIASQHFFVLPVCVAPNPLSSTSLALCHHVCVSAAGMHGCSCCHGSSQQS